jgi:hypothetical protein
MDEAHLKRFGNCAGVKERCGVGEALDPREHEMDGEVCEGGELGLEQPFPAIG